jgi:hypothetical protein
VGSADAPVSLILHSSGFGGTCTIEEKLMQYVVPVESVVDLRTAFPLPLVPAM